MGGKFPVYKAAYRMHGPPSQAMWAYTHIHDTTASKRWTQGLGWADLVKISPSGNKNVEKYANSKTTVVYKKCLIYILIHFYPGLGIRSFAHRSFAHFAQIK